jgi:hypothetical protein
MFAKVCLALFIVAGVLLHHRRPNLARRLARACPLILVILGACLLATGAHRLGVQRNEAHRWLGHGMVVFAWIAFWFSLGVLFARERVGPAIAKGIVPSAAVGLIFLASFTGYLVHPWDDLMTEPDAKRADASVMPFDRITDPDTEPTLLQRQLVGETTLNRFIVLHMIAVPVLLTLLLLGWCYLFRPNATVDQVVQLGRPSRAAPV